MLIHTFGQEQKNPEYVIIPIRQYETAIKEIDLASSNYSAQIEKLNKELARKDAEYRMRISYLTSRVCRYLARIFKLNYFIAQTPMKYLVDNRTPDRYVRWIDKYYDLYEKELDNYRTIEKETSDAH